MDNLYTAGYIDEIIGLNYLYLTRSNEPRQRGTKMTKAEFKAQVAQYIKEVDYAEGSEWGKASAREVEIFLTQPNEDSNMARIIASFDSLMVRDYALGISVMNPEIATIQLNALLNACPIALASAPATILAILAYSSGNTPLARVYLDKARQNYPLAKLIKRVILANWAPSEFATMTQSTHPRVSAHIFGELVVA